MPRLRRKRKPDLIPKFTEADKDQVRAAYLEDYNARKAVGLRKLTAKAKARKLATSTPVSDRAADLSRSMCAVVECGIRGCVVEVRALGEVQTFCCLTHSLIWITDKIEELERSC